ncbi:3-hydroxyacyl-CoA dehydrogenase NAD-binding domain-containing protein [Streptococcus sp. E24BD]|uniref:3-hydroxyacyl-CoA dehydrogenase NAD-binding domain-containing protein n=1 Tax=Streptococcus sp. E24BD TaxID=3278715 RepID=UPI00359E0623
MSIKRVTVAGGGVLGSQIAYQAAVYGFEVTLYDISQEALETAKGKIHTWANMHHQDLGIPLAVLEKAEQSITYTTDITEAFTTVDLVIEAVAERLDIKKAF